MSGQWWESDLIVGPFTDIAAANAWAAANPSSLFNGLLATAGGATVMWGGSAWAYVGTPYVGANVPATYIADYIWVDNAAVPSGRSRLGWSWGASKYVPPAGEPIAIAAPSSDAAPIALVTPGVLTLTKIWSSPVIPDYMTPYMLEMEIDANLGVMNSVSQAAAVTLGVGISGGIPTGSIYIYYPCGRPQTPESSFYTGIGAGTNRQRLIVRHSTQFRHPDSYYATGSANITQSSCGPVTSGENRLYAMAKPGHVSDQIRFDRAAVYSKGNL